MKRKILVTSLALAFATAFAMNTVSPTDAAATEIKGSISKNKAVQNDVDKEKIKGGLPAEIAAREAADADLQEQIVTNGGDIGTLTEDLAAEVAARLYGDAALQNQVNTNQNDIVTLFGELAAETAAREAADEDLQGQIDSFDLEEIKTAICNIYDQTSVAPRPAFCPEPVACPCWPGVTPDQISTEFAAAADVADPVFQLSPGYVASIGDLDDGDPLLSAIIYAGSYACKAKGMGEIGIADTLNSDPNIDDWMVGLSYDQALRCYHDLEIAGGTLGWPAP